MATTLYAVPLLDTLAKALNQAWARLGQRQFEPLARWQLLHIDQNGELQRTTVDVLEALPLERMILVRCSPEDEPLAIQLGRIIEAIDGPTGRKVRIDQWLAYVSTGSRTPSASASGEKPSQGVTTLPSAILHPWERSIETSTRR